MSVRVCKHGYPTDYEHCARCALGEVADLRARLAARDEESRIVAAETLSLRARLSAAEERATKAEKRASDLAAWHPDSAVGMLRMLQAEERAQRAEAERDVALRANGELEARAGELRSELMDVKGERTRLRGERDTARAHVETLKAALRHLLSTARSGAPGFIEACAAAEKLLKEEAEMRGGLCVRKGAPICPRCRDDEEKRLDCRACGGTGLANLEDVR